MSKIDSAYNFLFHPLDKAENPQHRTRAGKLVASVVIGIFTLGITHFTYYMLHRRSIKQRTAENLNPVEQKTSDAFFWTDNGAYPIDINTGKPLNAKGAKQLHEENAAKGSPIAQFYLGYFAEVGIEGKVNLAQAREYYQLAAKKNPQAQYKLAYFFEFGLGGEKNLEIARALYRQAAERSNLDALLRYAFFLEEGIGGDRDPLQATKVYNKWIAENPHKEWIQHCDYFIPYNQNIEILNAFSTQEQEYPKLHRIISKFNGLCELICNHMLIQGILRIETPFFLMNGITLESLNKEPVVSSHTVDMHKKREVGKAFFFDQHPDNIFSKEKQKRLLKKEEKGKNYTLNEPLILEKLRQLKPGEALKVHMFNKNNMINISGHTLLIGRANDSDKGYIFFDPDVGEYAGIFAENVVQLLQMTLEDSNAIFFTSGSAFLAKINAPE